MTDQAPTFMYRTERLGLKRLGVEELSGNYPNWFSDETVNRHNSHFRRPETPAQVRRYVESLDDDSSKLVFAVYWLDGHVHVGNVAIQRIDAFNGSAELAFLFGEKAYWNRGVAAEATEQVIEHCRRHLNLRRLYLGCFADNKGMCRLAEKSGFQREGSLREAIFADGRYRDVWLFGRLIDR